ncbi:MAG TPA: NAD-dependent epimerase/dehydratase family protein [Candidatus Methylomirabilis sp.]|nr:NAD-dependent epimerase/dehydratase family protein [Candidatus Methylomirabilis sp.]
MPTLFLTGGTGFVGSHVAHAFHGHGWRVRALVRRPDRVGLLPDGVEIAQGDLSDPATYRGYLKGSHAVVHCAGATRAGRLAEFRRVNVEGTRAIATAAAALCPKAMFVHVSSQAAAGPCRDDAPVRETDPALPVSRYGRSKLESELALSQHHPGPWCIIRPSIVYGPGDAGLLPMFAVVGRGVAPIPTGRRRQVQLLAAEDLAEVLFATAQRPDLHGRCGFAAGDTVTVADLMREVAALCTPRPATIPLPDLAIRLLGALGSAREVIGRTAFPFNRDKAREMLQADWLCDGEPLLRDLRVTASTRWRDGIRRTCRWYVEAGWLKSQAFAGV